jgi:hypothetical protein
MSYILNILIYVGMILLDNLLQYFLFIIMIDLSSTFDSNFVASECHIVADCNGCVLGIKWKA